jgi:hypothetical protein
MVEKDQTVNLKTSIKKGWVSNQSIVSEASTKFPEHTLKH